MTTHHPLLRALALSALLVLTACGSPAAPGDSAGTGGEQMKMSLKDLIKLGKNYTCTFTETDTDGNKTEGTIYVQGGDKFFRGDFTVMMGGKPQGSHMIAANKTSYLWGDSEPQGIMMKLKDDDSLFGDKPKEGEEKDQVIEEDEPMDMNCAKWSPDHAKFTPPKDVTFIDFEEQLKGMMGGAGMGAGKCAACDQIPDAEGKAECKKALGC